MVDYKRPTVTLWDEIVMLLESEMETSEFHLHSPGVLIHKTAVVEDRVTFKAPLIIGPDCFVAAGCYLRGGVILRSKIRLGPGVEVARSIITGPNTIICTF